MLLSGQRDGDWDCKAGLHLKMKGSWVSSWRTLLVLQAQVCRLCATREKLRHTQKSIQETRVNRQWEGKAGQHNATGTILAVHQNLRI